MGKSRGGKRRQWGQLRPGEAVGWQWQWDDGAGAMRPASAIWLTFADARRARPDRRWGGGALLVLRRVVFRLSDNTSTPTDASRQEGA